MGGGHLITAATNTLAQQNAEAEKWNTLRPVCFLMPTGNNNFASKKRPKSLGDLSVSAADRNLSKLKPGDRMARMCAVLNFSNALAGPVIGLMQQVGLLAVESSSATRELVTWFEFNINTLFSWALMPLCLKGVSPYDQPFAHSHDGHSKFRRVSATYMF